MNPPADSLPAVLTAWLLAFGQQAPSRASLTLAEGIGGLVGLFGLLSPLVLHLVGVPVLPLAISLLVATLTAEVLRQSGQAR